MPCDQSPTGD